MARKTRRIQGGFPTKYHEYAHFMKRKIAIDINEFKSFLDSQIDPLKQTFVSYPFPYFFPKLRRGPKVRQIMQHFINY